MQSPLETLRTKLRRYGQEHVLAFWDRITDSQRAELIEQISRLDLEQLQDLFARRHEVFPLPASERMQPIPVVRLAEQANVPRRLGEAALRRGEIAALVVAGGHGTRLGFDRPKGMFAIGPVSGKSLFQIHVEKTLALRRRYGCSIPLVVMTSRATHEETAAFFRQHAHFGMHPDEVMFFRQGEMPALDFETGKLLLEAHGRLLSSPNGHGGVLAALDESNLLARLHDRGVRHVFYFQVDNPLVKISDPAFLGQHVFAHADVSCKVVAKLGPADKMGNFVLVDGRCAMIEYSDLPEALATQTDERGRLRIWAGNPAIHLFSVEFLQRVAKDQTALPFHLARKKVPFIDAQGKLARPEQENALKFERFIFDVLPLADRWLLVETDRREEFVPLKNATGPDSPAVVKQAMSNLSAGWLERAGVTVPRLPNGDAAVPLEISPFFALDAEELAGKVDSSLKINGPLYLNGM